MAETEKNIPEDNPVQVPESEEKTQPTALSEDQEAFLKSCEEEFADRFTDADADYKKLYDEGIHDPPIVDPWYNKPRRNYSWTKRNDGRDGRGEQNGRRYERNDHKRPRYTNYDNYDYQRYNTNYRNRYRN